jgi:VWFA-related protein
MILTPQARTIQTAARQLVLLVLAAGWAMIPAATAQELERRDVVGGLAFVDEVQVTVVNIDVFVRDKDERVVTGLGKEDFRLLLDGNERPLTHFAAYTEDVLASLAAERGAGPKPLSERRDSEEASGSEPSPQADPTANVQPVHVVLYVDNENLRPFDRNRVLPQVRRFLRTIMLPHVQVMVVSAERSVRVVQGFTNNSREIEDALRDLRTIYGGRTDDESSRKQIIRDIQRVEDQKRSGGNRSSGVDVYQVEESIRAYGEELSLELGYSASGVREITTSLAGLPGRKILVHISSGLPMVPARDLVMWWGDIFQQRSVLPMLSRFNRRALFDNLASTANAQGVTFYTIDATGLGGVSGTSTEYARPIDPLVTNMYMVNHQEPLQYLAETTGGRAILDANDVTRGLEELRDDLFSYYSLGYTLNAGGSDTVHRLTVELPKHPEYRLVYRRTFVEKSIESRVQDAVVSGLVLDLDDNPMGLELSAGAPRPASDNRWILPIEAKFPIASVALLPQGDEYVGRVAMFLANRNVEGRQSDIQRREFEIRMPSADYETRRNELYVATFELLMEEGSHRVVVGLLDPVTRQTSFARLVQTLPGGGD